MSDSESDTQSCSEKDTPGLTPQDEEEPAAAAAAAAAADEDQNEEEKEEKEETENNDDDDEEARKKKKEEEEKKKKEKEKTKKAKEAVDKLKMAVGGTSLIRKRLEAYAQNLRKVEKEKVVKEEVVVSKLSHDQTDLNQYEKAQYTAYAAVERPTEVGHLHQSMRDIDTYERASHHAHTVARPVVGHLMYDDLNIEGYGGSSHQPKGTARPVVGQLHGGDLDVKNYEGVGHHSMYTANRPVVGALRAEDILEFEPSESQHDEGIIRPSQRPVIGAGKGATSRPGGIHPSRPGFVHGEGEDSSSSDEDSIDPETKIVRDTEETEAKDQLNNLLTKEEKIRGEQLNKSTTRMAYGGLRHRYLKSIGTMRPELQSDDDDDEKAENLTSAYARQEEKKKHKEEVKEQVGRRGRFMALRSAWGDYEDKAQDIPLHPSSQDKQIDETIKILEDDVVDDWVEMAQQVVDKIEEDDEADEADEQAADEMQDWILEAERLKEEAEQRRRKREEAQRKRQERAEKRKKAKEAKQQQKKQAEGTNGSGAPSSPKKSFGSPNEFESPQERKQRFGQLKSAWGQFDVTKGDVSAPDLQNLIISPTKQRQRLSLNAVQERGEGGGDGTGSQRKEKFGELRKSWAKKDMDRAASAASAAEEEKIKDELSKMLDEEERRAGGTAVSDEQPKSYGGLRSRYLRVVLGLEPQQHEGGPKKKEDFKEQADRMNRFGKLMGAWSAVEEVAKDRPDEPMKPEERKMEQELRDTEGAVQQKWFDYSDHANQEQEKAKSMLNSEDSSDEDETDDEDWLAEAQKMRAAAAERERMREMMAEQRRLQKERGDSGDRPEDDDESESEEDEPPRRNRPISSLRPGMSRDESFDELPEDDAPAKKSRSIFDDSSDDDSSESERPNRGRISSLRPGSNRGASYEDIPVGGGADYSLRPGVRRGHSFEGGTPEKPQRVKDEEESNAKDAFSKMLEEEERKTGQSVSPSGQTKNYGDLRSRYLRVVLGLEPQEIGTKDGKEDWKSQADRRNRFGKLMGAWSEVEQAAQDKPPEPVKPEERAIEQKVRDAEQTVQDKWVSYSEHAAREQKSAKSKLSSDDSSSDEDEEDEDWLAEAQKLKAEAAERERLREMMAERRRLQKAGDGGGGGGGGGKSKRRGLDDSDSSSDESDDPVQAYKARAYNRSYRPGYARGDDENKPQVVKDAEEKKAKKNLGELLEDETLRRGGTTRDNSSAKYGELRKQYLDFMDDAQPDAAGAEAKNKEEWKNKKGEREAQMGKKNRYGNMRNAWEEYDHAAQDKPARPTKADLAVDDDIRALEDAAELKWRKYAEGVVKERERVKKVSLDDSDDDSSEDSAADWRGEAKKLKDAAVERVRREAEALKRQKEELRKIKAETKQTTEQPKKESSGPGSAYIGSGRNRAAAYTPKKKKHFLDDSDDESETADERDTGGAQNAGGFRHKPGDEKKSAGADYLGGGRNRAQSLGHGKKKKNFFSRDSESESEDSEDSAAYEAKLAKSRKEREERMAREQAEREREAAAILEEAEKKEQEVLKAGMKVTSEANDAIQALMNATFNSSAGQLSKGMLNKDKEEASFFSSTGHLPKGMIGKDKDEPRKFGKEKPSRDEKSSSEEEEESTPVRRDKPRDRDRLRKSDHSRRQETKKEEHRKEEEGSSEEESVPSRRRESHHRHRKKKDDSSSEDEESVYSARSKNRNKKKKKRKDESSSEEESVNSSKDRRRRKNRDEIRRRKEEKQRLLRKRHEEKKKREALKSNKPSAKKKVVEEEESESSSSSSSEESTTPRNPDGSPWKNDLEHWTNPPKPGKAWEWGTQVIVFVPRKTDCWRKTRHNLIIDNAPFCWHTMTGDFEVIARVSGEFKNMYDRVGLMLRENSNTWVMSGIEWVNNRVNHSTCATREFTDWSATPLKGADCKSGCWICMKRIGVTYECYYSVSGQRWIQSRQGLITSKELKVGICAACPMGEGYRAVFDSFQATPLDT